VGQDCSFATKQESRPALLVVVHSARLTLSCEMLATWREQERTGRRRRATVRQVERPCLATLAACVGWRLNPAADNGRNDVC
jgi:hypothetical protein